MTLGQLRTFLAVADTGSVRAAAALLVVTQPAVSSAVAALQREIGVALVRRDGRGLRLTPAGERYAAAVRQALGLLDAAGVAARAAAAPERGALRLASVTTAAEHVLPAELATFRAASPDVDVSVEVGNRAHVWRLLANHHVDLVIAGRPPAGQRLAVRAVRPNALILAASPRLAPPPGAATEEALAAQTWLLREPGSGTRAAVEEVLADLGIAPRTMTLGSNGAIRASLRAGIGVAVVSEDLIADDLRNATLVRLDLPGLPLDRPWHLVAPTDPPPTPTAELFAAHVLHDEGNGWHAPEVTSPGLGRS